MTDKYSIKDAVKEDVPEILQLIKQLAVYEKEPDAVVATPELMIDNIFERKYAQCLIARCPRDNGSKGEAVGMALYFFTYSTWLGQPGLYLEDLYVSPEHRGRGLGKQLFGYLGLIAKEKGCGRVEWRVLKWNKPAIDFYVERLKAESLIEWDTMRVEGNEGIDRLAALK